MILTATELGGLLTAAAVAFFSLGILPRLRAVLAFVGVLVLGTAGTAGAVLSWLGVHLQAVAGSVTSWFFGAPLAAALFLVLAIVIVHDLRRGARKRTTLIAVLLAAMLSVGVSGFPAMTPIRAAVVQAVDNGVAAVNSATGAHK